MAYRRRGTPSSRRQIHPQLLREPRQVLARHHCQQVLHQLFLPGLTEDHPIDRQRTPQGRELRPVSAEGRGEDVPFYLGSSFYREEPEGDEVGGVRGPVCDGAREHGGPGVGAVHRRVAMLSLEVLADGVALVAVDTPFALLEVDGVRREVPVDDRVAVGVEVEALFSDN